MKHHRSRIILLIALLSTTLGSGLASLSAETWGPSIDAGLSVNLCKSWAYNGTGQTPVEAVFPTWQGGFGLGFDWQFDQTFSLGMWSLWDFSVFSTMVGDYSKRMDALGLQAVFGDKVNGFAAGPSVGVSFDSLLLGASVFAHGFWLRASWGIPWGEDLSFSDINLQAGYSIFLGENGEKKPELLSR